MHRERQPQPDLNRGVPPFDNPDLRHAMSLSLDRRAFIDIMNGGQGDSAPRCSRRLTGLWGMPPDMLRTLPGYDPDVEKNRAQARSIMEASVTVRKTGYGQGATRNVPAWRDPAVILIAQLKEIYVDGELDSSTRRSGIRS